MNHQPNELVALEWLIAPLNEQINALYAHQEKGAIEALTEVAIRYKEIHGVLTMAHLPDFCQLANLIMLMADHVSKTSGAEAELFLPVVLHANKLLQHELNHYVKSGFVRKNLLILRSHYLGMLLKDLDIETEADAWQVALGHRFSTQISLDDLAPHSLNEEQYQEAGDAWYSLSDKLENSTQDKVLYLGNLHSVATRMAGAMDDELIKKLWTVAVLWIDSLILNEELHADDVYLLGKFNRAFGLDGQDMNMSDMLWLENILIDVYVSLMNLPRVSRVAREMLSKIDNSILTEQTFFSFITLTLSEIIKSLDDDRIRFDMLSLIKDRLANRGWSFYAGSLSQIISYAEDANSSGSVSFNDAKAHIKTKLQTLHDAIKKTNEAIDTAGHHHDGGALNEAYIATEEIKNSFSEYLDSKDVGDLPDSDGLNQLTYYFAEMQMNEVVAVGEKFTTLFLSLRDKAPNRISWQLAHDIADGLSLFEMFLDNLSKQIFDQALLTKAEEVIDISLQTVLAMTDKNDDVLELFDIYAKLLKSHENTILYDDSGAIEPVVGEVVHSYVLNTDDGTPDDEDIEDVIIEHEMGETSPKGLSFSQRQVHQKPASSTLVHDQEKSKDILLTDILSLPDISLSDGDNNNNDLTVSAIKARHATQEPAKATTTAYEIAKASLKDDDFSHDKEFRAIFVEEADEVIDELHVHLQAWQKNPSNFVPLKEVRRHFHTLKGSGRMVGAFGVGETAWAIENMLNRVLDDTIAVSDDVVALVDEAADIMPIMVQDFTNGQPPSVDNALIVLKANNILKERPLNDGVPQGASVYPATLSDGSDDVVQVSIQPQDVSESVSE
ncbi:MAG: Hpt domain-containing protein, partial [Moraxella sp.]|nr:Hpt domain-containing protein [Moraxella sp.]